MNKKFFLCIVATLFFSSCDLSPNIYKEILIAQDFVKEQNFDDAVKIYLSILEKKPPTELKIKINYQLGDIHSIYLNEQVKALSFYNSILSETDDPLWQIKVLEKLADINFQYLKDYDKSIDLYKKLKSFKPKLESYDFYQFREALSYFEKESYLDAIKKFEEISNDQDQEYITSSKYYLGLSYFYLRNWNKCIENLIDYVRKEKNRDKVVDAKFILANAYETSEELKKAYNIYYSILGDYPNPEVIKGRLESLYKRRVSRKR